MLNLRRTQWRARSQRGVTMVEVLVGMAVGLFVVAGGLVLLANFTGENRRLLVETRLTQDLRAAADLVARDVRRAGYWGAAGKGVWRPTGPNVPQQNDYRGFIEASCDAATLPTSVPSPTTARSNLCYYIAGDTDDVAASNERYGFQLQGGAIRSTIGGAAAQSLTDPNTITITSFTLTPHQQTIDASGFCSKTCTTNCPRVVVREFEILITGNAPSDAAVSRTIRGNVRVRNDYYDGQCPA